MPRTQIGNGALSIGVYLRTALLADLAENVGKDRHYSFGSSFRNSYGWPLYPDVPSGASAGDQPLQLGDFCRMRDRSALSFP
jgi:hypothetical protein